MLRTATLSIIGLAVIASAQAGTVITLGSNVAYNGTSGIYQSQNGLTAAYLSNTATGSNACVGAQLYGNTCASSGITNGSFSEKNYDQTLFSGALNSSGQPLAGYTGSAASYNSSTNTYTFANTTPGKTITTSDTTYSMLNDNGGTNNFWDSTGTNAIVIPVGVQGVDAVYTLLNDLFGLSGSFITVSFNFGTTSSVANLSSLTATLVEGATVSDAIDCGAANQSATVATGSNAGTYNCTSYQTGMTGSGSGTGGITISADQAITPITYSSTTAGPTLPAGSNALCNMVYCGTTGSVALDEQDFNLSTYEAANPNSYLVSISISDSSGALYVSRAGLSAVTIDTVDAPTSTPEPSTWMLFGTGLCLVAWFGRRRKTAAQVV